MKSFKNILCEGELFMKKAILLLSMFIFCLMLFGCSKVISSNDLIYDSEKIDEIAIGIVTEAGTSVGSVIKDEEQIKIMVNLLKDIEIKEIPKEEEIFHNVEVWSQKVKLDMMLLGTSEKSEAKPDGELKGLIMVLQDGNLIFINPKMVGPFEDNLVKETIYYISTKKQTETVSQIVRIIEEYQKDS